MEEEAVVEVKDWVIYGKATVRRIVAILLLRLLWQVRLKREFSKYYNKGIPPMGAKNWALLAKVFKGERMTDLFPFFEGVWSIPQRLGML